MAYLNFVKIQKLLRELALKVSKYLENFLKNAINLTIFKSLTVPGSLTIKVSPKPTRKKKTKRTEMLSSDEQESNEIKMDMESAATSVIRNTKLEHMQIEMHPTPASNVDDGQHFIIDDNITVESNIEIEFITSDELVPSEMEGETIDYEHSDTKYENEFVNEIDSQHDNDDYDGGNESWDNVSGYVDAS